MMELLFIRGLAREKEHWYPFLDLLKNALQQNEKLKDYVLLTHDLKGCGLYHRETGLTRIEENTEFLREKMSGKIDKPILVGLSMGGMVALDWSQRYPDEIAGLIMINSSSSQQPFWQRFSWKYYGHIVWGLLSLPPNREKIILSMVSNRKIKNTTLAHWLSIQEKHPVNRKTFFNMLAAAARYKPKTYDTPTPNGALILSSRADRLVSWRCSETLASSSDWPLLTHNSAGHDIPLDEPQWLCEQIMEFLQR